MTCTRCYGRREILDPHGPSRAQIQDRLDRGDRVEVRLVPCPECGGTGQVHCCDGMQAQGECGT